MTRRGGRSQQQAKPAISDQDVKFMEDAIRSLPKVASPGGESAFADKLLNFGYHTNPYVRTFTSVLWSGYALSRGQVVDSDARFRKAREDATMSNVDKTTIAALDSAHSALQHALAPTGSVASFLEELRNSTIQRMWSRVCETAMLPPPSFGSLLRDPDAPSEEELEAAEMAELAAFMKTPPPLPDADADAGAAASDAASDPAQDVADDDDGDEAQEDAGAQTAALSISVQRAGGAATAPELVLQAAAEVLKQLRVADATGNVEITITAAGVGKANGVKRGRRRRRRR